MGLGKITRGLGKVGLAIEALGYVCLLYTSPSPRD